MKTIHAADLFAGAGGGSTGLLRAAASLGLDVDLLAINHWPTAVETHLRNHPHVRHLCESIDRVNPRVQVPSGRLSILLAGPECTHFSTARGGRPVNPQSRASAWSILKWAQELYIDTILIENVPEFRSWGPIGADSRPLKSKKGETYRAFLAALRSLGYAVEDKILNAADYGDPTTRQRLFILARRRNLIPISWPAPSHSRTGATSLFGSTQRWRAARDVIDWSLKGKSIFTRKKPLQPATVARIIAGLEKFGGPDLTPFLVILRQHMGAQSIDRPMPTIAAQGQHVVLCEPFLMPTTHGRDADRTRSLDVPLPTITGANRGELAIIEPFVISAGGPDCPACPVSEPLGTVLTRDHRAVVEPFLTKYNRTATTAYSVNEPLDTVTTRDRFALVQPIVNGYVLDIHFRMLQPHELAAAMSFPNTYVFGGTRKDMVKQIGNAWPGELATALCMAALRPHADRQSRDAREEEVA